MLEQQFHENMEIQHVNMMPRRAFYIPYQPGESAYRLETRYKTKNITLLNGDWDFEYFNSLEACMSQGEKKKKDTLPVPSVWNLFGYDQIQYLNTQYPIPFDPPYIPKSNPCGRYTRSFEVTTYDAQSDYHLNFEGVDSAFYVWVNNQFIGYSQISHSISEFDISKFIHEGTNNIQVLVLKYSDGTYFEDQDMFRHSGIFRDVYILKRAQSRVDDFKIETHLADGLNEAFIDVGIERKQSLNQLTLHLYSPGGNLVSSVEVSDKYQFTLKEPQLWSPESPELYTLLIATDDEVITQKVGIREVQIKDNQFYINGQSIKIRGTNHHDSDPNTGYVMSEEKFMKDLELMKQGNFNAIRTAHYPKSPLFYELTDQYGFYVMSEADLETHGVVRLYGEENTEHFNLITDDPQYRTAIIERIEASIVPLKNYSSIVSWSMGNESGFGINMVEGLARAKQLDATRPLHYEGTLYRDKSKNYDVSNVDMISRMYPSPNEVEERYLKNPELDKPFILCEYAHAMGNSPGDLRAYHQLVEDYDSFIGGFVWEWCDHGVQVGLKDEEPIFRYGGDFGERLHDGNFCVDGIVFPDRTPHEGYYEFKHEHRPLRVIQQDEYQLTLRNQLDFTNIEDYLIVEATTTYLDGTKQSFEISFNHFAPHTKQIIDLNEYIETKTLSDIILRYRLKNGDALRQAHFDLGYDQIVYQRQSMMCQSSVTPSSITLNENNYTIEVSTDGWRYTFNKLDASLKSVIYRDHIMMKQQTENKLWRAPTDNDAYMRPDWEYSGYKDIGTRVHDYRIQESKSDVSLIFDIAMVDEVVPPALWGTLTWTIQNDGTLNVDYDLERDTLAPFLPRFGLAMTLPNDYEQVEYYGHGPYSSYQDKGMATYLDYFNTSVVENSQNHIKPQESGSHNETTFVKLSNGPRAIVITSEDTFSFNTTHYSLNQLTNTAHKDQLEQEDQTYLYIDYAQSGIGSNSCGPELVEAYRLNDKYIKFNFNLNFE